MHAIMACTFACSYFLQILAQLIKDVLPVLRARISTLLVAVTKKYASYGEITGREVYVLIPRCVLDMSL